MSIFNSLGSNYNLGFVLRSLFASDNKTYKVRLEKLLEEKYNGKVALVYKGREAIRLALRIVSSPLSSPTRSGIQTIDSRLRGNDKFTVAVCGFTCIAVYEAIKIEGYNIEYLDIEKDSLNFSAETLKNVLKKNSNIKIVIVQNTLGYPCDIETIAKICKEKNIVLIEDLAHSIGAVYENGVEAGSVGDFVMLSFSQDKIIDGVAGGALIVQSSKFKVQSLDLKDIRLAQQNKDRFYPLFTYLIRKMYGGGVGKILHFLLRKADLLSKPVENSDNDNLHSLPSWYCKLIYNEFGALEQNIQHRKKIADIYFQTLNAKLIPNGISASYIDISSNLRFPIFIENRKSLINSLKKNNIYVSDIWYDAPIAPKKYLSKTDYKKGICPNSEAASESILNLPTHRNVSEKDAKFIAENINIWLKSQ